MLDALICRQALPAIPDGACEGAAFLQTSRASRGPRGRVFVGITPRGGPGDGYINWSCRVIASQAESRVGSGRPWCGDCNTRRQGQRTEGGDVGMESEGIERSRMSADRQKFAVVIGDAIDEAGGHPGFVSVRATSVPNDWVRISIENTAAGQHDKLDLPRVVAMTRRGLAGLGLAVIDQVMTMQGGLVLARPRDCQSFKNDIGTGT